MPRKSSPRSSSSAGPFLQAHDGWRTWTLTLLGLGFALLVITMLLQRNRDMQEMITAMQQADTGSTVAAVPQDQGLNPRSASNRDENNNFELLYDNGDAYYPMGLALLKGYYTVDHREGWSGEDVTCDAFVVTAGPSRLLAGWDRLRGEGSGAIPYKTVNDEQHYVIGLNLDADGMLTGLTEQSNADIRNSSVTAPVEIKTFVIPALDGGVDTCFSPVHVLDTNNDAYRG